MSYDSDTNKWSMELIYDLMGICGFDLLEEVKSLPEEDQNDFWIAYEHYKNIKYWETKEPKQGW